MLKSQCFPSPCRTAHSAKGGGVLLFLQNCSGSRVTMSGLGVQEFLIGKEEVGSH